jgi:hypothetical protein
MDENAKALEWPLCNVDTMALVRIENVAAWLEHANVEYHMVDGLIADLHKYDVFLSEEDYQALHNLNELSMRLYHAMLDIKEKICWRGAHA